MRGAGDEAISRNKEQIATLSLVMTRKCRYYDITKLRCGLFMAASHN
ncbi:MAG: hypothetical protein ACK5IQ_01730 [Bacteroidales bacterium]